MAVNINRNVDDLFYRYKMPRLVAKVEGKGNGIKTVIANMPEIAKALNRPPTYPTKFFGCELGAQTQFDTKNERYIVNGDHDAAKLQDILDGFIKRFVLCPACENPETVISLQTVRKGQIAQSCKACGHAAAVSLKHKLATFILKNPPPAEEEPLDPKKAKGKKGASPADENGGDEFLQFDANAENGGATAVDGGSGEASDDEWQPDETDDVAARPELTGAMATLTMNADLEKSSAERLDMFFGFLSKQQKEGKLDGKTLVAEAERLDIKDKATLLLCRGLLSDGDVLHLMARHRNTLLRFCIGDRKAQKYLLGGVEQLLVARDSELLPKTAHVLKALYDHDIVEEDVILDWGRKASKKYVEREQSKAILDKAAPFLDWLKQAEEESEEDNDDDEQVQVEFGSDTPSTRAPPPPPPQTNGAKAAEDDFDIDDI